MTLILKNLAVVNKAGAHLFAPITANITPGKPLAIVGPSGVGKTSLLNAIAGFLPLGLEARGEVILNDRPILSLVPELRRVGLMFQNPLLFPHMTVGQNLGFALDAKTKDRDKVIADALERAALRGFADRRPHTLSGGQRSRVALLRALLAKPHVLLLDEAFANLDLQLREEFRAFTLDASKNIPVLMVTHDASDAEAASDQIVLEPTS